MAFIFKTPNSKNWIAGFRNTESKRVNRSTGLVNKEVNRKKAQSIADQFEDLSNNRRTSQHVRRVMAELHERLTGEDMPTVSCSDFLDEWIESVKTSVKPTTEVFYRGVMKKLREYLGKRADLEVQEITRGDIEGFRNDLLSKRAPKTTNNNLKVVKMIFRSAKERTLITDDPTEFVRTVKSEGVVKRRPFTVAEIEKTLESCDDEWRSMVMLGFYTGQRLGDIARLRWSAVDLKKEEIEVITEKTGKKLKLPIHPVLLKHLKSMPRPMDSKLPVHQSAFESVEVSGKVGSLSNQFARILYKAGLRERKTHRDEGAAKGGRKNLESLSFHCLRRSAATMLHEAGVHESIAKELIGHNSSEIHSVYVNLGSDVMKKGNAKLPNIG